MSWVTERRSASSSTNRIVSPEPSSRIGSPQPQLRNRGHLRSPTESAGWLSWGLATRQGASPPSPSGVHPEGRRGPRSASRLNPGLTGFYGEFLLAGALRRGWPDAISDDVKGVYLWRRGLQGAPSRRFASLAAGERTTGSGPARMVMVSCSAAEHSAQRFSWLGHGSTRRRARMPCRRSLGTCGRSRPQTPCCSPGRDRALRRRDQFVPTFPPEFKVLLGEQPLIAARARGARGAGPRNALAMIATTQGWPPPRRGSIR